MKNSKIFAILFVAMMFTLVGCDIGDKVPMNSNTIEKTDVVQQSDDCTAQADESVEEEVTPESLGVECWDDQHCDDDDKATIDTCVDGVCVYKPINCPSGQWNEMGECICTPVDDNNPCTVDSCDSVTGIQSHVPKDCDDGDINTFDVCKDGECYHTLVNCADDDPCTRDFWDGQLEECLHVPLCDDDEVCIAGDCVWKCTQNSDCSDGNPCTLDSCDLDIGRCSNESKVCDQGPLCSSGQCNPANGACVYTQYCTGDGVTCEDELCVAVPVEPQECNGSEDCDDGYPCTNDDCMNGSCQHTPVVCGDGEVCDAFTGDCLELEAPDCSESCGDGDLCTIDSCNPDTGECEHKPVPCGADTVCIAGMCMARSCQNTPDFDCNDNDPCTLDYCGATKCIHESFNGSVCGPMTVCVEGLCILDPQLCLGDADCDDGNGCTVDSCNSSGVCEHTEKGCESGFVCSYPSGDCVEVEGPDCPGGCDDGNPSTYDSCQSGECVNSQPVSCGEGTVLNADTGECDPVIIEGPECIDGQTVCRQMGQEMRYLVCVEGQLYTVENCGPVGGQYACIDGTGCILP